MRRQLARLATTLTLGLSCAGAGWSGCAAPEATRTLSVIPLGSMQRRRVEADRTRRSGRFCEAIALYESLLEEAPEDARLDVELRHGLSLAYWDRSGRIGDEPATAETRAADQAAAVKYARQALGKLQAFTKGSTPDLYGQVGRSLGRYLRGRGQVDQAIELYGRFLAKVPDATCERVRTLHELGNAYLERGGRRGEQPPTGEGHRQDLAAAGQRQGEALELARQLEDCPTMLPAWINNSLGLIHRRQLRSALAAERFAEAERICAEHAEPAQHWQVLVNLILALVDAGRYEDVRTRCDELRALPGAVAQPRILTVLGLAALNLGDFSEAAQQFDLARHAAHQDPDCQGDLTFMAQLAINTATCAQAIGAYDEAERHLTEVRRRLEAGAVDPRTSAVVEANLGRMYLTLERVDEAEERLVAVLDVLSELQGPRHPDTLLLLLDLGNLAWLRGHVVEALRYYEEALEGLIAARGQDHPLVAQARLELATLHRDQGRCAEALAQATEALRVLDARLGPNHKRSVLACLKTTLIAADCRESPQGAGQFATLRAEATERFGRLRDALGPRNVEVLQAMVSFADMSAKTPAAHAQALDRYRQAEEAMLAVYGDGVLSLADLRLRHGQLLERMDRAEEAFRVYDRARRAMDRGLQRHPNRAALLAAMGDLYQAKGNLDQARRFWQEAYDILTATYGSGHPRVRLFWAQHGR